ncbi:MAG: group 1 glycosyl transferase [Kangiellaceae bacterium]|nr:group 1 glycosyl transferase [Kangiellaceae bacterium]
MLNILVLSYLYPNNVFPNHGIFVHNRIKAVAKRASVTVINPIPTSPVHRFSSLHKQMADIPEQEAIDGIQVYHPRFLSIPKVGKQVESVTYRRAVQRVVRQLGVTSVDVVDLHWTFPDLPAGVALAKQLGAPLLCTIRGKEALHEGEGNYSQRCVQQSLSKVDGVIGVSRDLMKSAMAFTREGTPGFTIRNGVATERFVYQSQAECRDMLGIPHDYKVIFSVGSLIYRKGFDLTLKALARLRDAGHNNLHFYIGGSVGHEGNYSATLQCLVDELKLRSVVHFVGQIANKDLAQWYNAADIYCLSSRGEGSPNVLTEALSCGCPSVVADVGAAKEIVESEPEQGICVAADSVDGIEQGIRHVLATDYDRSLASQRFAKYTWDWCADEVLNVYQKIAAVPSLTPGQG